MAGRRGRRHTVPVGFIVNEGLVREAWATGAKLAVEELDASRRQHPGAHGGDLGDLRDCLDAAVASLAGVTDTTVAVLGDFHDDVEACLTTYATTDGASAGTFNILRAAM